MGFWATLLGAPPAPVAAVRAADDVVSEPSPMLQTRTLEQVADVIVSGQIAPDVRALPAVTGARRLIASTIDQLSMTATSGDMPYWLRDPRASGSPLDRGDVVQHTVDAMLLHGRAFWMVRWTSGDRYSPTWQISPLHPGIVDVRYPNYGWPTREFIVSGLGDPTPEVPVSASDLVQHRNYLLHIPYVVTVDHPAGTTPLRESESMLRGVVDTELFVSKIFASGTHVGGYLTTEYDITNEQGEDMSTRWMSSRLRRRMPVLGNGLEYKNDVPNARDLQMVEARSFNQSVVWALLGIPMAYMGSSLMGGQSSLSYANAQDNRRQFADNCLRAFTTQIEDAVSRLLPLGQRAMFDYSEWEGRADDGAQTPAADSVPSA